MDKNKILNKLFESKENIQVSPRGVAVVGTIAPAGTPKSKNAERNKGIIKFNRAAIFLDDFLKNQLTNVMCSSTGDFVYCEIKTKYGVVKSILRQVENASASSSEEVALSIQSTSDVSVRSIIYPIIVYGLHHNEELNRLFNLMEEAINISGCAATRELAQFCDSFYYYLKNKISIDVKGMDDDALDLVINARIKNVLQPLRNDSNRVEFEIFKGISVKNEEDGVSFDFIYDRALKGEFKINYQWDAEVLDYIPPKQKLEQYVPSEFFAMALLRIYNSFSKVLDRMEEDNLKNEEIIGFDDVNTLVFGNPGTGKTAGYYAIGAALGIPVYTCTVNPNTEEDEFQGKTKFVSGVPESVYTPCLNGFVHGGIVLGEEIDLADAGVVMGALGQAVEAPHVMEAFGYDLKFRHPLCAFCFTKNNDANGSSQMNEAFNNRLRQTYELNDMSREHAIKILTKRGFPKAESEWVYSIYEKIVRFLEKKNSYRSVIPNLSIRTCIGTLENMQDGWNPKKAVVNSLVNKISSIDVVAGKEFTDIFNAMNIPQFRED